MNNKEIGTEFEKKVCDWLAERGFWVHFIEPNKKGAQPFDIIAARDGFSFAFECKTLVDNRKYFPLSRLEENQRLALNKWHQCGNWRSDILIGWRGKIVIVPYDYLCRYGKANLESGLFEEVIIDENNC